MSSSFTPRSLWSELIRVAKAQLSSGIATGSEWLLMTGLVLAGVHYLIAAALGAVLGAGIDFSIKKWWVFSAGAGVLHAQAIRYAVVSGASAGLNSAAAYALVGGIGLPEIPGVILASIVVGLAWKYPLHRLFVFPAPPPSPSF